MTAAPAILVYGAQYVTHYTEDEFSDALRRAFAVGRADFITLDSNPREQRFLSACAAWGIARGFLYVDRVASNAQSEVCSLRLTEAGRQRYLNEEKTP